MIRFCEVGDIFYLIHYFVYLLRLDEPNHITLQKIWITVSTYIHTFAINIKHIVKYAKAKKNVEPHEMLIGGLDRKARI